MTRYTVYLDPAPPHDGPDYPATCPETPAGYAPRGYLEWHDYAERRTRKGDRQVHCPHCQRWTWTDTPCSRLRGQL